MQRMATASRPVLCENCESELLLEDQDASMGLLYCDECVLYLCWQCDLQMHKPKKKKTHIRLNAHEQGVINEKERALRSIVLAGHRVCIQENVHLPSHSGWIWDSSVSLAAYLDTLAGIASQSRYEYWSNKRVFEFGCGVSGLPSIAAALLGAGYVMATDFAAEALTMFRHNLWLTNQAANDENRNKGGNPTTHNASDTNTENNSNCDSNGGGNGSELALFSRLHVSSFTWGESVNTLEDTSAPSCLPGNMAADNASSSEGEMEVEKGGQLHSYDILLGGYLLWNHDYFPALAQSIADLSRNDGVCFLTSDEPTREAAFLTCLEEAGLQWEKLYVPRPSPSLLYPEVMDRERKEERTEHGEVKNVVDGRHEPRELGDKMNCILRITKTATSHRVTSDK